MPKKEKGQTTNVFLLSKLRDAFIFLTFLRKFKERIFFPFLTFDLLKEKRRKRELNSQGKFLLFVFFIFFFFLSLKPCKFCRFLALTYYSTLGQLVTGF
jgi:hypothetical protein